MWECLVLLSLVVAGNANPTSVGVRQRTGIVGGNDTTIENYPYMVALLHSVDGTTFFQYCGGSIIGANAIMTAAHCPYLDQASNWRARAGSTFASSGGVVYSIKSFIIHPNFERLTLNNDISIMRPTTPISFVDVVKVAVLPAPTFQYVAGLKVWAAGWGVTEAGVKSEILRHVEYNLVDHNECIQMYKVRGIQVTENMVCAGDTVHGGKDQCYADSGGPLVHNGVVIGIASGGIGCGEPKFPGIDTNVARYAEWVQKHLDEVIEE